MSSEPEVRTPTKRLDTDLADHSSLVELNNSYNTRQREITGSDGTGSDSIRHADGQVTQLASPAGNGKTTVGVEADIRLGTNEQSTAAAGTEHVLALPEETTADTKTSILPMRLVARTSERTMVPSPLTSPLPPLYTSMKSVEPPPHPPPKDDKYRGKGKTPGLGIDIGTYHEPIGNGSAKEHEEMLDDSRSEIASIMDQFEDGMNGPKEEDIMSPRLELGQPMFGSPTQQHPPRKSSLEPLRTATPDSLRISGHNPSLMSPPPRSSSLTPSSPAVSLKQPNSALIEPRTMLGPSTTKSLPPPPQPDPESDLPFDFHRFLEQLRHRTADPVAKFLRSFLLEFAKKQWMVHEQVKIISDFLEFITKKMAQCDVWRTVSDAEFDNAREGMEKLVMNRLYTQTFSPAIPAPEPLPTLKSKRRGVDLKPGRRGQHQEDVERDQVLAQKVRIYGWVAEEHLDISPIGEKGRKFMSLAQQELLKIKSYRAPRDKVICVLNCCKVIFGFLRNGGSDQSADSFVPLLIYVVLHANPDHLVSNVQYILRFRNQDKLGGEAGYYISSLMGAIQFIENLDRTSLTISDEDFEKNVEAAVSAIAEKHLDEEARPPVSSNKPPPSPRLQPTEKSAPSKPEVTPRNSLEVEVRAAPRRSTSVRNVMKPEDEVTEENAALAVLRTIQRPLSSIGRMFSDDTPAAINAISISPLVPTPNRSPESRTSDEVVRQASKPKLSAEELAARQASAEAKQARDISAREVENLVETLRGMFPQLDEEVIVDVVRANEGRVGKAVDACLAMSAT